MRLCLIAPSLDSLGGQAVQAAEILNKLKLEGFIIVHLPINPKLNGFWFMCQRYKYLRTIVTTTAYLVSLLRTVRKCDILHIFSASYFSFILAPTPAVLIGSYFNKKIILNYHSGEAEDHLSRSGRFIKWILNKADVVAVPSVYLHDIFSRFGICSKVVYNIVDQKQFQFTRRKNFGPNFIVTRNLEPMYNVGCVLRAFKIIQGRYQDAKLTILGSGSQEDWLKKVSKELDLRNVTFAGKVGRHVIAGFYKKADFMLNSSNVDNAPISILEAFSSGIPVISTAAGGIPFMISDGHNGMLVPLNDEREMARKAIHLLENQPVAAKIARDAFSDCLNYYSWEANRDRWLDLYTSK